MARGIKKEYSPPELSKVLEERMQYYVNEVVRTFENVYSEGKLREIGRFESEITDIIQRHNPGKLEKISKKNTTTKKQKGTGKRGRKPQLTYEVVSKDMEQGGDFQKLKVKYTGEYEFNSHQLNSFINNYKRGQKKGPE